MPDRLHIAIAVRDTPDRKFDNLPEKVAETFADSLAKTLVKQGVDCHLTTTVGHAPRSELLLLAEQEEVALVVCLGVFEDNPIQPSVYDRLTGVKNAPPADAVTWVFKDVPVTLNKDLAYDLCKRSSGTIRAVHAVSASADHLFAVYSPTVGKGGKVALLQLDVRKSAILASVTDKLSANLGELTAKTAIALLCPRTPFVETADF